MKIKKLLMPLLCLILVCMCVFTTSAASITFSDVGKGKWYTPHIEYAVENGIFNGTSATTFSPDMNMTRAQFVQVFANMSGVDTSNKNVKTQFSDVPSGKWYTPAVKWAAENGVVNGMGDGKFAPEQPVTREQMCVMLVNYVEKFQKKLLDSTVNAQIFKDDAKIASWAKTSVYKCAKAGLVNGVGENKFAPQGTATRAQGATFFSNFHKYLNLKITPEEFLSRIDGYYWYLDGYEYTYLHPNVIPWYDPECLDWESKNLYITKDELVAYEKMTPSKYWEYEYDKSADSTTHNNLLVNPIEFTDSLISDFNMRVSSNKLYMTVGGTEYSFTRYSSPKTIEIGMRLGFTEATAKVGEHIFLPVEVDPFWTYYQIEVLEDSGDNYAIAYHDRWYTSASYPYGSGAYSDDGKTTLIFKAQSVGERTLNIRINGMQKIYQLKITVEPEKVTGITLNKSDITLIKGETETITATVFPSNASNKNVTWSSSNPDVATVSISGKITAIKHGEAIITATTEDGGYKATCKVIVKQSPLIVNASIAIETRFTNSSIIRGVSVRIHASGGSENYVAYSIKLYHNGVYVGEVSEKEMFATPVLNGTYTAEVYVKDSSGNEATSIQAVTISY